MCAVREEKYWNPYTERSENKWAASEFGLVVSRQNGKGSVLEARELAGLFLFGERLIIHSAHQFDTSVEAFERILMLIENTPDLDREVAQVKRSHGEEGIFLKSGQRLRFRTRSKGGGRGFTCDTLILDEAMLALAAQQINAIFPTISARPNGQVIYTGSAGTAEAEQFGRVRSRAIKGGDPDLGFMEYSIQPHTLFCPPECDNPDHDDPMSDEAAYRSNPSVGIRISIETIQRERRSMSHEGYLMERLSVGTWPSDGAGWLVIPQDAFEAQERPLSKIKGKHILAVDTAPDSTWTCISAAGQNSDNDFHLEITSDAEGKADYRPGIKWAKARIVAIWQKNKPAFVVIDPTSPAGILIPELEAEGVKVLRLSGRDFAQYCGEVKNGIAPKAGEKATIVHIGQAPFKTAVAAAESVPLQDLWRWSKTASSAEITPLTSATLALGGYRSEIYKKRSKPWAVRG